MRFGLVGYGAWGRLHAQSIAKAPNAELAVICCSGDDSAASAKADYPDAAILRDYRDLIRADDVDVVDVVVPNHLHAEIGLAALDAGKHVLLEKPLANTLADCDRLCAAAARGPGVLSVGHELRLSSQWRLIKELIDAGAIGRPRYANFSLFRFPFRTGTRGWRYEQDQVGSWLLEEAVHFYDLLLWYFEGVGRPTAVRTVGNTRTGSSAMSETATTTLAFPGGPYAVVSQCLLGFEHHFTMEIAGDEGSIRTWWSGAKDRTLQPKFELKVQRAGSDRCETLPLDMSGEVFELEQQIEKTVTAIGQRRPLVSGPEARRCVYVCLQAERSMREEREIALEF